MRRSIDDGGSRMADQDEDGNKTVSTRLLTIPPVQTVEDLPEDAEEGSICFVHERGDSFIFVEGSWVGRQPSDLA
jgi:hypothetical protein